MQVLLVDDDANLLSSLERLIRRRCPAWEVTGATGGVAGLEAFDRFDFDVVISDLRMPKMDGIAFLREVREHHPRALRIVLSSYADEATAAGVAGVAHQFLNKPCPLDELAGAVERARSMRSMLGGAELQGAVGWADQLPAVPALYARLVRALGDPAASTAQVAAIVEQDPAIAAKLLQLANSAFLGRAVRTASVGQAVAHLGLKTVRSLLLHHELMRARQAEASLPAPLITTYQQHALLTARIAATLAAATHDADDAFLAGLLHDAGKLLLGVAVPAYFAELIAATEQRGCPMHVVELEARGVTHAELGGLLFSLWGLPQNVTEAISYHHAPGRSGRSTLDLAGAIHIADALAHEVAGDPPGARQRLDPAHLKTIGLADAWPQLLDQATGVAADRSEP